MFYKETNFKKTRCGMVPQGWDIRRLGTIAEDDGVYYGLTAKAIDKQTRFRMLRTTDIKDYSAEWTTLPFCEITEKRNNLSKFFLRKGELVVARAGTTGVSVLIDRDLDDIIFGSYLIKIRLKSGVYPKFIHQFFQSKLYWQYISSGQAGSTLKNINLPILKSLEIPLPPAAEQKAIAEVLSTLDEAVQKTNEVIAKTERLKKGLMQELLTRGIGHKEFKDTEIGRIPKEWDVVELGEITTEVYRYPTYYNIKYEGDGIAEVRGELIKHNGELERDVSKYRCISKETSQRFPKTILQEGDFILSVRGTMGKVAIVPSFLEGANMTANLMRISLNRSKCHPPFFKQIFLSDSFRRTLGNRSSQTTIKTIQAPVLKSIRMPLPPLGEQQKIAEILSTVDQKLEVERNQKAKLERIKQGMMDLLLTGKIRVKVS